MNCQQWNRVKITLLPFNIITVFLLSAFIASFGAEYLGFWAAPVAGPSSAFCVVVFSYYFSPYKKMIAAVATFIVGTFCAWHLISDIHYPEWYGEGYAYRQTYMPLLTTYIGGLFGLLACIIFRKKHNKNMLQTFWSTLEKQRQPKCSKC